MPTASGTTVYTFNQLESLAVQAGFPQSLAPTMAAIALAESGGNPLATNPNDTNGNGGTQTSWGLWQISNGTHQMPEPNILDPNVNAKAAFAKYQAHGLSPWGTYDSGAYKKFLNGNAVVTSGTDAGENTPSDSTATGCAAKGNIFGIWVLSFSYCDAKAWTGGLLIGVGGAVALTGVVIVVAWGLGHTSAGKGVVGAAAKVPGVAGLVAKAL